MEMAAFYIAVVLDDRYVLDVRHFSGTGGVEHA